MILDRITFTGVDKNTDLFRAYELARNNNFIIEYGILVSKTGAGKKSRYPTLREVKDITASFNLNNIRTALHICGSWSRQLLQGDGAVFETLPALGHYQRFQWNINPPRHTPEQRDKYCGFKKYS